MAVVIFFMVFGTAVLWYFIGKSVGARDEARYWANRDGRPS